MKRLCGVFLCLFVLSMAVQATAAESPAVKSDAKTYTLVLLRHGESVWNKEDRFTGWSNVALTEKGLAGALKAGELMKKEGLSFDIVYTSYLDRAIKTSWLALEGLDEMWIPVQKDWRLNERCYGDLEGKTRDEVKAVSGAEQVKIWRRSFDVPPPPMSFDDPRSPVKDPRYAAIPRGEIPQAESLKETIARVQPYWKDVLAPAILSGQKIMVVGHSTGLRALVKCFNDLSEKDLQKFEIPNSVPLVFVLDANLKPLSYHVLGEKKSTK